MKQWGSLLLLSFLLSFLPGCAFFKPYKADIEQGNIIPESEIQQIRYGMTKQAVKARLGEPVLVNVFTPNQTVYVYTLQKGYGDIMVKKLILTFNKGWLAKIERN